MEARLEHMQAELKSLSRDVELLRADNDSLTQQLVASKLVCAEMEDAKLQAHLLAQRSTRVTSNADIDSPAIPHGPTGNAGPSRKTFVLKSTNARRLHSMPPGKPLPDMVAVAVRTPAHNEPLQHLPSPRHHPATAQSSSITVHDKPLR